ncbi:MAG: S8 family serine peptidase [Chloroflexi bacterium]|nr:S8 family serine peptidase [Chloroflexota bacterium]
MKRHLSLLLILIVLLTACPAAGGQSASADDGVAWRPLKPADVNATGTYIIQLVEPSLATYRGDLTGLAPTSPAVTGARKLDVNTPASKAYLAHLAERRTEFLAAVQALIGRPATPGYVYDTVLDGLTLELTPGAAAAVAALPMVKQIQPNFKRELLTDRGPRWIGAPALWDAPAACAPGGFCGEGIIVGVVDTGINTDHPSFADVGGDGYDHTNPLGSGNYKGWCNPAVKNPPLNTCNDKLIGLWSYSSSGNDPEDPEGHGSHTASTAAGNRLNAIVLDAPTIDLTFDISGVAPHANIIAYDACTLDGCPGDALLAAINQAVTDGVDVINYSIGSAAGTSPWVEADALAFLDARAAGIFVAASAGNNGPSAGTMGSPAGAPWLTTVAAATHDRALVNSLVNLTTDQGADLPDITGRSVTADYGPAAIVYAGDYGNALCLAGVWPINEFSGQIVVCDRGNNGRVEKSANVQAAGGGGMILANAESNGDELIGDAHSVPAVHITYADGVTLKAWLANGDTGHIGVITGTSSDIRDSNGDVLAAFSSRGPSKSVGDVLKPDITAPGVDILAAVASGTGKNPPEFDIYSGTSMASPHMAGAGALMTQAHPAWTPAEIQSALMTTARTANVRKEDWIVPADPFDRGAGRVNLAAAVNAGLLLNVTTAEYQNADPALGGDPKTLNLASLADDACYQTCGWTRTVRNPTGTAMTWNGTFVGLDGLQGTLSPPSFTVAPGAGSSFALTISDVTGLAAGQWYFGTVTWHEASGLAPDAHFPVAVKVAGSQNGGVVSKQAGSRGTGPGDAVQFSIGVSNTVKSSRTFAVTDPIPSNAAYVNGSATGGLTYSGGTNSLSWTGSLNAATFAVVTKTLSGYQSLAAEGIAPFDLAGLDLDGGCFSLGEMDFNYLDTHYTDVIVSVNGVMRAGFPGGLITRCPSNTNQNFPATDNPFHTNDNLIAPWWADLDMTGGNLYGAVIGWNGVAHTVIEWENALIKETNQRVSFQLWIQDGTDNIWFAYPSGFNASVGKNNPKATVGAENATGTEGVKYYYYGGSGSPQGTVPTGAVDVWVGLNPTIKQFTYQATATGPVNSNITNEATVTVASTPSKAWANARICGPAIATPATIGVVAEHYASLDWSAGASPHNMTRIPARPWATRRPMATMSYARSTARARATPTLRPSRHSASA